MTFPDVSSRDRLKAIARRVMTPRSRTPPSTAVRTGNRNSAWVAMSTGTTYTNFTGQADETAGSLTATAYGANMDRLRRIKAQYDPDNCFRLNPNIPPA